MRVLDPLFKGVAIPAFLVIGSSAHAGSGEYRVQSENGVIHASRCPADFYQCSGVDWKSENGGTVLFDFVDPEGDPPHPSLQFVDFAMNSAHDHVLSLWNQATVCGKDKGVQKWSLKKEGRYFHFKLNSNCGTENHSIEAVCQAVSRICTDALRAAPGINH